MHSELRSRYPHNVIFDEEAVPSGVDAEKLSTPDQLGEEGQKHTAKFEKAGTYECADAPDTSADNAIWNKDGGQRNQSAVGVFDSGWEAGTTANRTAAPAWRGRSLSSDPACHQRKPVSPLIRPGWLFRTRTLPFRLHDVR